MKDEQIIFTKTIGIKAPVSKVWLALTDRGKMQQWMSEFPIEIITDWRVGHPFIVRGAMYKKPFENKGIVLALDPERFFSYSHLSSLSRLPDTTENYTVLEFSLNQQKEETVLNVAIRNFPTEAIYKHMAFYWNVAPELLRKFVESVDE